MASVQARVLDYLRQRQLAGVSEAVWRELCAAFPQTAPQTLRKAVRASGLPLAALVEGARLDSFAELERSLAALTAEYPARPHEARTLAITAKTHADLVARNPKVDAARREEAREMALWLRTWLENPPLFADWLVLRLRNR